MNADIPRLMQVLFAAATQAGVAPVYELRALKAGRERTISGCFTDSSRAAAAAYQIDERAVAPGVYVTLNPILPELVARADNHLKSFAENTTGDKEIVRRLWLLVDLDAKRPAGISSSDEEHAAALALAADVRAYLREADWPDPIYADSGNGAHLLYRIDLPNDDHSTALVKRCLEALQAKFGGPSIGVDQAVFNAARISKIYGTHTRKGDPTPTRPHRRAAIIDLPSDIRVVSVAQLQELAGPAVQLVKPPPPRTLGAFDLRTWLATHGIGYGTEKAHDGSGWVAPLDTCPFSDAHTLGACVGQQASGAPFASCRHDTCQGKTWHDLRESVEPKRERASNRPPPHRDEDAPPPRNGKSHAPAAASGQPVAEPPGLTIDVRAFVGDEEPEGEDVPTAADWVIPRLVPRAGLTIVGGPPKIGKTWAVLDMAIAVASGQAFCGHWPTFKGRVMALLEEDTRRRISMRLWRLARGRGLDPRALSGQIRLAAMAGFRLDREDMAKALEAEIVAFKPDLLLVDALSRVHSADENDRTAMRAITVPLQDLCARHGTAIGLVHHFRKLGQGDENKTPGELLRGSGDLWALARSVIGFTRRSDSPGLTMSAVGNDGETPPSSIVLESGNNEQGKPTVALVYRGLASESNAAEDAQVILGIIKASPVGLGIMQVRKAVREEAAARDAKGMSNDRITAAIAYLNEHKLIYRGGVKDGWRAQETSP